LSLQRLLGLAGLLLLLLAPGAAAAAGKVALVIGNGGYQGLPALPNSRNDATDMAAMLQGLGFEVIPLRDADRGDMLRALARFRERIAAAEVALFYFSGHGVQVAGRNFLVPIGGTIRKVEDVPEAGLDVGAVLEALAARPRAVNLVILDACSDSTLETRDGRRPQGLARLAAPEGTLIAYAADVDQLASGGWDRNSAFTGELLKHLAEPGLRVEDVFQRTREKILEVSRGQQRPVEFTALVRPYFFIPPPPPKPGERGPAEPLRKAGDTFQDCPDCPSVVVVPAGRFRMGSASGGPREQPVREVTIARPFAIGRSEVTVGEWQACVTAGACPPLPMAGTPAEPARGLNWDDAQKYARWLAAKTGRSYRLPSEAEWEYAARAGTATAYPWGDAMAAGRANCRDCGNSWDGRGPAPAGSFPANTWGLQDMHGNVWEWVEDCAHDSYAGAPLDGSVWPAGFCRKGVLRGGSFRDPARVATSSFRATEAGPGQAREDFGFRVVRVLQQ
jgi:formylglycine-generating enzyme required for sulfatase activity